MKNKKLLGILGITALLLAGNFAFKEAKEVDAAATKTIYLKPSSEWSSSNAYFWVHSWGAKDHDVLMTDNDGDGIYEAEINSGNNSIIFVRNNPAGNNATSWDYKWNQTADLTIPSGKNQFNIVGWTTSTSWTTYTAPTIYMPGSWDNADWVVNSNQLLDNDGDGVYSIELDLLEKDYDFKIAYNGSWNISWGIKNATVFEAINDMKLDGGSNITLKSTGGVYHFDYTLDGKMLDVYRVPESESVKRLFTKYYNSGTYTKETELNVNTDTMIEIKDYFHAGAQAKYRRTEYTENSLIMYSGDSKDYNKDLYSKYENVETNGTKYVKHSGTVGGNYNYYAKETIDDWFVTLNDFSNSSETGWTYTGGVYTFNLENNEAMKTMAREFVAPMWLSTDLAKEYIQFDKLTVQETANVLVMKLYVKSVSSGNLEDPTNLVFSQATITK